jgi:effector-binding domain-containing protein
MNESMDFLSKKEIELSEKIKKLKKIRKQIKNKIENLKELNNPVKELPTIEMFPEKYLMEIELKKDHNRYEMEAAFLQIDKEAEKYNIDDYKVSVTIKVEDILKGNFYKYYSPSFTLPKKTKGAKVIKEILAGSIIHRGSFDLIGESYKKLLEYIESEGYFICGDSVEFSNKNTVYMGEEKIGALTKIVIPICKKDN